MLQEASLTALTGVAVLCHLLENPRPIVPLQDSILGFGNSQVSCSRDIMCELQDGWQTPVRKYQLLTSTGVISIGIPSAPLTAEKPFSIEEINAILTCIYVRDCLVPGCLERWVLLLPFSTSPALPSLWSSPCNISASPMLTPSSSLGSGEPRLRYFVLSEFQATSVQVCPNNAGFGAAGALAWALFGQLYINGNTTCFL